jgi:formyltetrahydrofolate deformylase
MKRAAWLIPSIDCGRVAARTILAEPPGQERSAAMTGTDFVLTLDGPDRRGIVAAVAGVLADEGCTIRDSQQFGDRELGRFFMRVELVSELGPVDGELLAKQIASVAEPLGMRWNLTDAARRHRLLVMASRDGHCLNDLLFRVRTGAIHADVVAVVSNHRDLEPLAQFAGVPFHHVPVTPDGKPRAERRLRELIDEHAADTVVLARYMQILTDGLCRELTGRAINIHHSLLPSFKGAKPYRQAHARGVKVLGATAHYVTADLDEGPIIEQDFRRVSHRHGPADLIALGRDLEAAALARAVKFHVENRVLLHGDRTVVFD